MFTLPRSQLLDDLAFEAGTAKHAIGPPAVEGTPVRILETGTHAAQRAEVLTTFRSLSFMLWILGYFQDLAGLHLIKGKVESVKTIWIMCGFFSIAATTYYSVTIMTDTAHH